MKDICRYWADDFDWPTQERRLNELHHYRTHIDGVAVHAHIRPPEGDLPREWAERLYDVARWTPMPRGGHFAAAEEPELLAADIAQFFADGRGTD